LLVVFQRLCGLLKKIELEPLRMKASVANRSKALTIIDYQVHTNQADNQNSVADF